MFDTIYFGGGTPSMLSPEIIQKIISKLKIFFNFSSIKEVTLESNPEDLVLHLPEAYKDAGITRLSLGIQSLSDNELNTLTRKHSPELAIEIISNVKKHFDNYSVDVIFSIPGQKVEQLDNNIDKFLKFNPPHLSAYILTFEEKTPLYKSFTDGLISPNNERVESELYLHLSNRLTNKGYKHYEVSSFAKKGYEAIHNSKYWSGAEYLGLGPSAHSYMNGVRWNNIPSVKKYSDNLFQNVLPIENKKELSAQEMVEEKLMLGLRSTGITLQEFPHLKEVNLTEIIHKLVEENYGTIKNCRFQLTPKGFTISDEITSRLLDLRNEN